MTPPGRRLYVYYRLPDDQVAAAAQSIRAAQQVLCKRHPGLVARLSQRPEASEDGRRTLMETYAMPAGIDSDLQAAMVADLGAALSPWCGASERRLEVFDDLP